MSDIRSSVAQNLPEPYQTTTNQYLAQTAALLVALPAEARDKAADVIRAAVGDAALGALLPAEGLWLFVRAAAAGAAAAVFVARVRGLLGSRSAAPAVAQAGA